MRQGFIVAMVAIVIWAGMTSATAGNRWNAPSIVSTNCSGCHGIDGNSQLPYVPRLAGLQTSYTLKKISAYREPQGVWTDELFYWILKPASARDGADNTRQASMKMVGISHGAKPEQLKAALAWYEKQSPEPGRRGPKELIRKGEELYMNGVAAQHILSCKTCHGPDAQGNAQAPRLAGQNGLYILSQLTKFRAGDRRHAPEMTTETRDLNAQQAREAAAYLQSR